MIPLSGLPTPPAAGHRVHLPPLPGSADAAALAHLTAPERLTVVVTADPQDAQRLAAEIAWLRPELRARVFPDWETLPFDAFSPHHDLISERLATLHAVTTSQCNLLLVPATTALYRLPPPSFLAAYTFFLNKGERLDGESLRRQLALAGYDVVTQVMSPGEAAFRGGLVDLFPMGAALPYRIDLFDDEIESIRTFDPDTQRSLYPVQDIRLLPAREFPMDERARTRFRQRFRDTFEGDPARATVYRDISNGVPSAGIEYFLPLFFEDTAVLTDYLPADSQVVLHGAVAERIQAFWRDTESRYEFLRHDPTRPVLPPPALFLRDEGFFSALKAFGRIDLTVGHEAGPPDAPAQPLPPLAVDRRAQDPLGALRSFAAAWPGRIVLVAESAGRRESLAELFAEFGFAVRAGDAVPADFGGEPGRSHDHAPALIVAPMARGFTAGPLALITENELFAGVSRRRKAATREAARKASADGWLRDLTELRIGDPVVHESHGIGRYCGLKHLDLGDGEAEFLELTYANNATLYVPVAQLAVISRYTGNDPDSAPLHTLGSGQWEKAKRKAALQARDTAAELLALYATRAARQGQALEFSMHDYEAFAEGFGFDETPDQAAAIDAVLTDMKSGKPMDRLVCGDVGFGKTEVALRAAFAAVAAGTQVAVLCPTTLLCEQHFQNFSNRFAGWPVRIAELSRFRTARESAQVLDDLEQGRVDVVIGTHKLLQEKTRFKRLGLVIIDEEHRFGVRQKEGLKRLRAEVDVLTLTATPIPRTLAMSLEGLRDFSVIATAPQKRLAIKTFVTRLADGTIREAVLRELKRGGQVFFLHNEVDTIDTMRARLEKLLPEARILVGHGQMKGPELERVMRDFTHGRANLLLCTTIIETGIDIPNANTILINRAEKFGLAQLHQLRGRVGRSHHQAYAYLLVDDEKSLSKQAKQRLEAIQLMEELGAGFYLAMHDLEIRGAGEVLGESQSGEMQEVGFALYSEMINRAVAALRQGHEPDLDAPLAVATDINLHVPALLPNAYCPDVHERLNLYKRLSNCDDADAIGEIQEELIDRFGDLPPQAKSLIESHRLRLLCATVGIVRLDASADQISVHFGPKPPIDPLRIIELIQKQRSFRLAGQDRLLWTRDCPTLEARVAAVRDLIRQLGK